MRGTLTLALALALAGCGDWTEYDGQGPAAAPAVGAGDLDESLGDVATAERLDHLILQGLLQRYVTFDGAQALLDYDGVAASAEARILLDQYLALLAAVDPTALADAAEVKALLFNAYNALTLRGVLAQYGGDPGWSVSDGGFVFFQQPAYVVGGVTLSLDQLEHGALRGDAEHASMQAASAETRAALAAWFQAAGGEAGFDPRLHMAINCASLGCPNLAFAFDGPRLEAQLTQAVAAFLSDPAKGAGPEGISQLFTWFEGDFARGGYGGVADFIERGRPDGLAGVSLGEGLAYSWDLNIVR